MKINNDETIEMTHLKTDDTLIVFKSCLLTKTES